MKFPLSFLGQIMGWVLKAVWYLLAKATWCLQTVTQACPLLIVTLASKGEHGFLCL